MTVDLRAEMASKWLMVRYSVNSMERLHKEMIHILSSTEHDSVRFHHATQDGMQFKTKELFIFGFST